MRERPGEDRLPPEEPPAEERSDKGRLLPFAPRLAGGRPRAFDPRAKLLARGASGLTAAELLFLVL